MQTSILSLPLCWAGNALEGKRETEKQLFSTAPKLKDPDNFISRTHQFSPRFPICFPPQQVIPGLAQEEEFELSKSTVFTKKPLDNFPIQINTERRDKKMAPSFSGSHNTKYLQLTAMRIKEKAQKHGISSSHYQKKNSFTITNCQYHKPQTAFSVLNGKSESLPNPILGQTASWKGEGKSNPFSDSSLNSTNLPFSKSKKGNLHHWVSTIRQQLYIHYF